MARRVSDGYFFAVKVYATGSIVGLCESRVVEHMAYIDEQDNQIRSNLLLRSQEMVFIPHP